MKKHVTSLLLLACLLCICLSFSRSMPFEMPKTFLSLKDKQGKNTKKSASEIQSVADSSTPDYKIQIFNATASSFQAGGEIGLSYDGNMNTLYHSSWSGGGFPITLTYNFQNTSQLDYIIYYPRPTGANGKFGETEIWYMTAANPGTYTKALDYDFQFTDTARRIDFPAGLQDVTSVRVIVKTGKNNFASCAEMEFYSKLPPPVKNVYVAGNTADVADDKIPVQVTGGTASNFQPGGEINLSFDNDFSTIYHSNWNGGGFPITLTYQLANTDSLNFMEYYPRQDGSGNGPFGELEVLYSTQNAPDQFTSLGNYNFNKSSQASLITFSPALVNPSKIRVIVKSGGNNFASCAEMKFYKKGATSTPAVFTDSTCSELKPGVTQATIDNMTNAFYKNIAQHLFNNTYQKEYRVQNYQAYPLVEKTAAALKTSTYNSFENPTGVAFQKDENIVVFVSEALVKTLQLKVVDAASGSMETSTYLLNKGINKITVRNAGLGYIGYYYDDWQTLPDVKVNIAGGTVNGYFDVSKHTNADWGKLLREAVYGSMDIVGKNVSLCYTVSALREYTPDDVVSFINLYDDIVHTQYEQMGLIKYNRVPKNRMYGVTTPSGGWRAGGLGAMFALDWGVGNVTGITGMRNSMWGIAHEFGHVNQIRPGLRWIGTAEVTNNIYSLWCSHLYGINYTRYRLETETTNDGYNNNVAGGRMNAFLNYGIIQGEPWQFQKGPDKMTGYENGGDVFVKLAPLWQLMMYYQLAGKGNSWYKPEWYADVAERVRNTNESGLSNGRLQLNFMKNTCDVVGEDLTDFFKKIGMLKPVNRTIDDYGAGQLTITQAECDEVVTYAAKYPKPASPVIYYLNINSIDAYKNKATIIGTAGVGVTLSGDQLTIDHQQWKNVAAFETYNGNTLLRAAIYGTGSTNNSSSKIQLPVTNASVYAVGWDGSRKLVYPAETLSASKNNESPSLQVYPMPFKNSLNVKLTANIRIKQVKFVNSITGVSTASVFNQQDDLVEIQSGGLLPGVYLLQLIDDKDVIQAQKVVKQ